MNLARRANGKKFWLTCFCILLPFGFGLASSSFEEKTKLPHFSDNLAPEILAQQIALAMTNEELLAQTLMFGWAGLDPSPLVSAWVEQRALGSIKIFGWNTDDTHKVASSIRLLQKKAEKGRFGIPLFVATDQEGGWIRHIKGQTSETPGNLAIGASSVPADAWFSGFYISRELAALGINLNFAPTIDLYTDHKSTVIGPRSFGEDPVKAGILGAAFMAGSKEAGVLTTAKHFPGHGDTGLDSHGKLPEIYIDEHTLFERELVPFKYLIDAGIPAVMSGHLSFPLITKEGEPATFSSYFLKEILREKMGFKGLIITDDIMMNGATTWAGSVSKAVELSLKAGNDIIESSTTPQLNDALWTRNIALMNTSETFRAIVFEAAQRIIYEKLLYFKSTTNVPIYPNIEEINARIPDPEGQKYFLSLAVRSTTLLKNKLIPLKNLESKTILLASNYQDFLKLGVNRFSHADTANLNWQLAQRAKKYDIIIASLASEQDLQYLKDLEPIAPKVIIVSLLSPVLIQDIDWAQNILAMYSYAPVSFQAAFAAIAGDFEPHGVLPLKDLL